MIELEQAAKVIWNDLNMRPIKPGTKIDHTMSRDFESVPNAVRFVMEKLSSAERGTAMIQTDQAGLLIGEITTLYAQIKQT